MMYKKRFCKIYCNCAALHKMKRKLKNCKLSFFFRWTRYFALSVAAIIAFSTFEMRKKCVNCLCLIKNLVKQNFPISILITEAASGRSKKRYFKAFFSRIK